MTDKKISELANITGSQVDDTNDEIAIVDASANETKAITRAELFKSVSSVTIDGDIQSSGSLDVGTGVGSGVAGIEVGKNRTANGYAYVDLVGDTTYTGHGFRMIRGNSGPNTESRLEHRGTGPLQIRATEAAPITFSITSSERMRIDSSGNVGIGTSSPGSALQVEGAITGTAVTQSATDTTAGRLLKVGDGGILESNAPTDLDDWDKIDYPSGLYRVSLSPLGDHPGGAGTVLISRWSLTQQTQLYIQHFPDTERGQVWTRVYQSDEWTDWRRSYDSGNILGTVSQSGGTPTGAIIERGSNANGEYIRFADGTQICTIASIDASASSDVTWTYPATFASLPSISGFSTTIGDRVVTNGSTAPGTTDLSFRAWVIKATPARSSSTVRLTAIGRWF